MLLRKTRQHHQGSSNRSQPHLKPTLAYLGNQLSPKTHPFPLRNIYCATSHLHKRQQHKKEVSLTQADFHQAVEEGGQTVAKVQRKLKQLYQGHKNIVKSLNGWGFNQRGWISKQQFREMVKQKTEIQLSQAEVSNLLLKIGGNDEKLDAKGLVTLIHQKSDGVIFNQTIFQAGDSNSEKQRLIGNLKQNLKFFEKSQKREISDEVVNRLVKKVNCSLSRMRQKDGSFKENKQDFFDQLVQVANFSNFEKEMVEKIKGAVNFQNLKSLAEVYKSIDSIIADPILRNVEASCKNQQTNTNQSESSEARSTFSCKIMESATKWHKKLDSSMKREPFDPSSMTNINQQKTRFGKSNFTKESVVWTSPDCDCRESIKSNQKDQLMNALQQDQNNHKQRYENKLQKLRQYRQKQQQNIAQRQELSAKRQQGRLLRMRNEQDAYNYVNYIKKRWE